MVPPPVRFIMPALLMGRPSIVRLVTVTVVPAGMERSPLPESVPLLHVIAELVTLIGAVPLSVRSEERRVGKVSGDALLSVSVTLVIEIEPVLVMELSVAVAQLMIVVAM